MKLRRLHRPVPCALVLVAASVLSACQQQAPSRTPLPASRGDLCVDLARVFHTVAESRDAGKTRKQQIDTLAESVGSPFVGEPEATLRSLTRVVDMVYEQPQASPEQFEYSVLARCRVNARGQLVLGDPPPPPEPAVERETAGVPGVAAPGPAERPVPEPQAVPDSPTERPDPAHDAPS